ncbi:hypothetical protein KIKIMORA_04640 [Brevundimonas phage vB_BpoS-Kikimora]|uniref:Uncharacterized protein n=1 Tax=Brevundimonas phage vB_BpoS-Kikimora TaxID=2948601 RepID=A0A9E7SMW8_9CAUD|nr:hypothetical protein KIKIMORA_04640 [Brevundimonas phage vB_BpoS-Kikimora]
MTNRKAVRLARKSKMHFARRAEAAALAGNRKEAWRLLRVALRKLGEQHLRQAAAIAEGF